MKGLGRFVIGAAMGLLSLIGLVAASHAADTAFYWVGLVFTAFGILYIYGMILRHAGHEGEA